MAKKTAITRDGWLVKSEPDVFGIDDLERIGHTRWDGVRNYQARNHLRAMRKGDPVLIYHSNCNPPSVVGLGIVLREGYPDPLQFDPSSEYCDPKSPKDNPRWTAVDIGFVERFTQVLSRDDLRALGNWAAQVLFSRGRLSVLPVARDDLAIAVSAGRRS
jgi:predicted RNA-binding protein with PUA-like domain